MPEERTYGFSKADATSLVQMIGTGDAEYAEIQPLGRGGGDAGRFILQENPTGGATGAMGDYMVAEADIYQTDASGNVSLLVEGVDLLLDFEMFGDLVSGNYGMCVKDARGFWLAVNAPCSFGA